jgi:dephospho-CoA kinase
MERDGISAERAELVLRSQMPIDEKVPRARFVVYNDGSLEATRSRVDTLWLELEGMRRAREAGLDSR